MTKELIILVGPPGSGKSTLRNELMKLPFHYFVNQDEMGKQHHKDSFDALLFIPCTIIVDRMNFNKEQRERYIKPAKEAGYKTKIIVLHESYDTCLERMKLRQDHPTIKDEATARKALHFFFTKYERPTEDEADEIEFRYPVGDKPKAIICDLDGTLCNIEHRLHTVKKEEGKKADWGAFFKGIKDDSLNNWCWDILYSFMETKGTKIVLASGRPDDHMNSTKDWLEKNMIMYENLFMRRRSDFRKDDIVKEVILDFEVLTRYTPLFFLDDRDQVVKMWRKRGFTCLQVADGNF